MMARSVSIDGAAPLTTFGFEEPAKTVDAQWAVIASTMGFLVASTALVGKITVASAIMGAAGVGVGIVGGLTWLASRKG